jgi:hypothetical protein
MTARSLTGYFRDADCWAYVTSAGVVYWVSDPDEPAPVWEEVGCLSPDAEPTTPDAEDMAAFERSREAHGIPA